MARSRLNPAGSGSPLGEYSWAWWLVVVSQVPWKSYPWTVAKSSSANTLRTSNPASIFAGAAGRNAVSS